MQTFAQVSLALLLATCAQQIVAATPQVAAAQADFFENQIRPLLHSQCLSCHGASKPKGGLRLDSRAAMLKGGNTGPAIVPGNPTKSLLITAVKQTDPNLSMPPKGKLTAQQVADLTAWIAAGAVWPAGTAAQVNPDAGYDLPGIAAKLWSFQPVRTPAVPSAGPDARFADDLDRFIAAQWSSKGLVPTPEASKHTLLRRVTFDLIGLPPTPAEIAAFVADASSDAYEKVVDRLLASPAYGERWGRHWLDLARYADTAGNSSDHPIPNAYLYRDWVVEAMNLDKPYDQFLTEQLAGDLLADSPGLNDADYRRLLSATGFISLSRRFGVGRMQDMHLTIEDTIDTVGRATMGMTMKCARCHTHKFDPISTTDYYALYGIFASSRYPFSGSENAKQPSGLTPIVRGQKLKQAVALQENFERQLRTAAAKSATAARLLAVRDELEELAELEVLNNAQLTKLKDLETEQAKLMPQVLKKTGLTLPPEIPSAFAIDSATAADVAVMLRGEPKSRGPVVKRGALAQIREPAFPSIPPGKPGRLELARWLTDARHPLTSRVIVNWVWHHHFGRGIVPSVGNFGVRGDPPSHPELLDHLARTFIAEGWSFKKLHRRIVTSGIYKLDQLRDPTLLDKDPDNVWLARAPLRRLDAEQQRDAMLAISGLLTPVGKPGDPDSTGPHPFPAQDLWGYTQHRPFIQTYDHTRRSLYLCVQRITRHPYLSLFDGADPNVITELRRETLVPLQALWSLNSAFSTASAAGLGKRLSSAPDDRIALAYLMTAGRPPTDAERKAITAWMAATPAGIDPWSALAQVLLTANSFMFID